MDRPESEKPALTVKRMRKQRSNKLNKDKECENCRKNMLKNIENNILSRENARTKAKRQNLKPERKKCGFWSSCIGIVYWKNFKSVEKRENLQ